MNNNNRMRKGLTRVATCTFTALTLLACGSKNAGTSESGTDINIIELEKDSTQYGIYIKGGKDSLQWISEEGDTAWLTCYSARIFGQLEAGDRLAVMMTDSERNDAKSVIDITQLLGRWVEPDAVDEGMMQGIDLQEGGAAASINSRANHYVSWRIYNGKILLVNSLEGMVDQDLPEDTLFIEALSKDSLKVKTRFSKHIYRHSNDSSEDKVKEYEDYLSPDAGAFNPEGEAPEGTSPEIPEEDKLF